MIICFNFCSLWCFHVRLYALLVWNLKILVFKLATSIGMHGAHLGTNIRSQLGQEWRVWYKHERRYKWVIPFCTSVGLVKNDLLWLVHKFCPFVRLHFRTRERQRESEREGGREPPSGFAVAALRRRHHRHPWFKVAVSAADLAGTVSHRYRRRGLDSGETRETLHRGLKKCWNNHNKT